MAATEPFGPGAAVMASEPQKSPGGPVRKSEQEPPGWPRLRRENEIRPQRSKGKGLCAPPFLGGVQGFSSLFVVHRTRGKATTFTSHSSLKAGLPRAWMPLRSTRRLTLHA
jgi:hypothetical protein